MSDAAPPRLDQDYINAIGSLVFACTELESLLIDLIAAFAGTDAVSALILAGHMQARSKTDSLLALMRFRFGEDQETKPVLQIISRIQTLSDFRNSVVHSYWSIDKDGVVRTVKFTARGEFKRTRHELSSQEIRARAEEAFALLPQLRSLRDHFQDTIKPIHLPEG